MRRPEFVRVAAGLVVVLALTACSRLSFVRPDATRGDFRRTAPEVQVRPDARNRSAVLGLVQLAQSRLLEGDVRAAREAAQRALKLDAKSPEAHSLMALVLDAEGRPADAGRHHRSAAELGAGRGAFLNNYGIWLCQNGRAAESLGWFDRAVSAPGYATPADARANSASCAIKAGQGERGEGEARQVLAVDPKHPVALMALARRMADTRRWLEARAFIERRLAAAPADADALLLASQIEHELGDTAAAARYGQRLRAEFPRGSHSAQEGENR